MREPAVYRPGRLFILNPFTLLWLLARLMLSWYAAAVIAMVFAAAMMVLALWVTA